jgi:hypothetical protein
MSGGDRDHSGLMFANFTTLAHFSVSAAMSAANSASPWLDRYCSNAELGNLIACACHKLP